LRLIREHGAIEATLARAAVYAQAAQSALRVFPEARLRQALLAVADYTIRRGR